MSNIYAFILGVLASWIPSAALFAVLVYSRGLGTSLSELPEAADDRDGSEPRTRAIMARDEADVRVPFPRRRDSGRRVSKS